MSASVLPNLGLFDFDSGDSDIADQLNENWFKLSVLTKLVILSRTLTAPPGSPANGDCYIPATGATGAWAGQVNKIAVWNSATNAWVIYTPVKGWMANMVNEGTYGVLSTYTGSVWSPGITIT